MYIYIYIQFVYIYIYCLYQNPCLEGSQQLCPPPLAPTPGLGHHPNPFLGDAATDLRLCRHLPDHDASNLCPWRLLSILLDNPKHHNVRIPNNYYEHYLHRWTGAEPATGYVGSGVCWEAIFCILCIVWETRAWSQNPCSYCRMTQSQYSRCSPLFLSDYYPIPSWWTRKTPHWSIMKLHFFRSFHTHRIHVWYIC